MIIGTNSGSAIGTLVERSTRFVIPLRLTAGRTAKAVRDAIIAGVGQLPELLRRSLTLDQGSEMAGHTEIIAALSHCATNKSQSTRNLPTKLLLVIMLAVGNTERVISSSAPRRYR